MHALTVVLTLSGGGKLFKVLSGDSHPMFGPGRLLPGWFLGVAAVHEFVAVYMLRSDEPLGLALSSIFMGGVLFTYTLPGSLPLPMQIPGYIVSATLSYAIVSTPGPMRSRLLGLKLHPASHLFFVALGMATGQALRLLQ